MPIELQINGYLNLTFFNKDGNEFCEADHIEINEQLKNGNYVIGLADKTLHDIIGGAFDLIGTFEIETSDSLDYEWNGSIETKI